MAVLRVQFTTHDQSDSSKDQFVNTFHLLVGSVEESSFPGVDAALRDFYSVAVGGGQPVKYYLSPNNDIVGGGRVKIYDLSDPIPRIPLYDASFDIGPSGGGGDPLPSEVACCLSYAGVPTSGIPVSSTRGRIYIGPLSTTASGVTPLTVGARPLLAFRTALVNAGKRLANDLADLDPVTLWVVHSPTHNTNTGIVRFWADDAWDTQRRRGIAPQSRVTAVI